MDRPIPSSINTKSISRTATVSGSSQLVTQVVKTHTHQTANITSKPW